MGTFSRYTSIRFAQLRTEIAFFKKGPHKEVSRAQQCKFETSIAHGGADPQNYYAKQIHWMATGPVRSLHAEHERLRRLALEGSEMSPDTQKFSHVYVASCIERRYYCYYIAQREEPIESSVGFPKHARYWPPKIE